MGTRNEVVDWVSDLANYNLQAPHHVHGLPKFDFQFHVWLSHLCFIYTYVPTTISLAKLAASSLIKTHTFTHSSSYLTHTQNREGFAFASSKYELKA